MTILVICNSASGLYDFRGMLLKKLITLGYKIIAIIPITTDPQELRAEKRLTDDQIQLKHFRMERRGMNPAKDFILLLDYIYAIQRTKPDLVITYTVKPNAYGGIASQICGVPYAVNITGLGTAFQNNGLLKRFVTILYKIAFRKTKIVFFENEDNRDSIVDLGIIGKERTHVLNGAGVDLEKFSYIEYPTDSECIRFLFIGRVMQEKGVDELFAAMRLLRNEGIKCTLDVLGGFDEDYSEIIKKYEVEGWLTYHGYQSDIRPYIEKCHCFVLPSWHEGMANTNLECAASGRPIITSNIHGCMEAVEDRVSGFLCESKDVNDLFQIMKKFTKQSYEQRREMGMHGRSRMEKFFDKKSVVEETIKYLV